MPTLPKPRGAPPLCAELPESRYAAALVFAVALPLLWLRLGHWFYLSVDEGIYLEGARRVASGQVPYRDFFVLTGPGSFWLYGALFHWFGTSLATARAMFCCELASLCASVCWLTNRFANAAFAGGCASLFLAMLLTTPYPLYITHRWDSNTFMLLALVCVGAAHSSPHHARQWLVVSGACAAIAAWITPPMLILALALAIWMLAVSMPAQSLCLYAAGLAAISIAAVTALLYSGAGTSLVRSLLWDASNYAVANRLTYGALAGSFSSFWQQGTALAALTHSSDAIAPVVLPPLAALACLALRVARKSVNPFLWLLGGGSVASLLACWPRFGAAQLLFGSAFFHALLSGAAACILPRRSHLWLGAGMFLVATVAVFAGWPNDAPARIETPVGLLNVSRRHHILLNDLLSTIRPGDTLFVYPYLPALYFVLAANNPTRYSFLQPGMMGPRDIQPLLMDLRAHPPRWIVWHDFAPDFILKNWPSSDPSRMRYPEIESFFNTNYHLVNPDGVVPVGYRLLERNP